MEGIVGAAKYPSRIDSVRVRSSTYGRRVKAACNGEGCVECNGRAAGWCSLLHPLPFSLSLSLSLCLFSLSLRFFFFSYFLRSSFPTLLPPSLLTVSPLSVSSHCARFTSTRDVPPPSRSFGLKESWPDRTLARRDEETQKFRLNSSLFEGCCVWFFLTESQQRLETSSRQLFTECQNGSYPGRKGCRYFKSWNCYNFAEQSNWMETHFKSWNFNFRDAGFVSSDDVFTSFWAGIFPLENFANPSVLIS